MTGCNVYFKTPFFISVAGMESVQLRRMWLQNYCLVVTATETRDQGKDPDTHTHNDSFIIYGSGCFTFCFFCIFPQIWRLLYVVILPPLSLLIRHSFWVCPTVHLRGADMCLSLLTPPNPTPTLTPILIPTPTDDHHQLQHKLPLSLLSLSHISLMTTKLYIIYYWNKDIYEIRAINQKVELWLYVCVCMSIYCPTLFRGGNSCLTVASVKSNIRINEWKHFCVIKICWIV